MVRAPASHSRRRAACAEPGAAGLPELPVGEHCERLAEPAVAGAAGAGREALATSHQLHVGLRRSVLEVLDLRAADAIGGVGRRNACASRSASGGAGSGGPMRDAAVTQPSALQALEAVA